MQGNFSVRFGADGTANLFLRATQNPPAASAPAPTEGMQVPTPAKVFAAIGAGDVMLHASRQNLSASDIKIMISNIQRQLGLPRSLWSSLAAHRLKGVLEGAKRQRTSTMVNLALPVAPALALPAPPAPSPADPNEDEEPLAPPAPPALAPTSSTEHEDDSSSEDSSKSDTEDDEPASQSTPVVTEFLEILDEDTYMKHSLYQNLSQEFDASQKELQAAQEEMIEKENRITILTCDCQTYESENEGLRAENAKLKAMLCETSDGDESGA